MDKRTTELVKCKECSYGTLERWMNGEYSGEQIMCSLHGIKDTNDNCEDGIKKAEAEAEIEGGGSSWWYVCSECHEAIDNYDAYCKHCGAKLKKAGEQNA